MSVTYPPGNCRHTRLGWCSPYPPACPIIGFAKPIFGEILSVFFSDLTDINYEVSSAGPASIIRRRVLGGKEKRGCEIWAAGCQVGVTR